MGYIGKTPTPQPLTATDIPDLPATKITSGTFPALNGSNLTNLDAADLTGTLPAISGANLTGISSDFVKLAGGDNITADSSLYGYYTSDYLNYKWIFNGISNSGTSNIYFRLYKSSGVVSSSSYTFAMGYNYRSSGSHTTGNADSTWNGSQINLTAEGVSSNANLGATVEIDIFDPQSAQKKNLRWQLLNERHDGATFTRNFGAAIVNDTDAMTGINIYANSGNFGAQHWALYGMKV